MVLAACEDITLSVKVGSKSAVTGTNASITGHTLNKDASEKIVVEIEYAADGTRVDGEFSVEFGDVSLTYSSVD